VPSRNIYLSDEEYASLLDIAIKTKRSLNDVIKEAIALYLKTLRGEKSA